MTPPQDPDAPSLDPRTRVVHAGGRMEGSTGLSPAIHQSSTFHLANAKEGADFTQSTKPPAFYTRWGNPTNAHLEKALAELEGAEAGLVTASGMGAVATTILAHTSSGARIVAQKSLYSATQELLENILTPRFGVAVTWVEPEDTEGFGEALADGASLVYLETPANPTMRLSDIRAISEAAHDAGARVAVDNTFANPLNQRPLDLGADIALHATTKSLGGHSDVTGGAILTSRAILKDLWYHHKVLGPAADPLASWLVLRGLRTLALRTHQMNHNALAIARFLEGHPKVAGVHYPGLESHPQHALAARQMEGYGGMLAFGLAGGLEAGKRLVEAVDVITLAVSLGGVETLVEHPASMTHGPLTPQQRAAAGIGEGLVRLSAGIEAPEDLVADLDQALEQA